jgi:hypothetical protein
MNHRSLLIQLLGLGAAGFAAALLPASGRAAARTPRAADLPFRPLSGPVPLPNDGLSAAEQRLRYARISLEDRLGAGGLQHGGAAPLG